jgi:predicted  nucleic acid-binding Zn-ribbon protein
MHPTMAALLELHDINQQRQLLRKQREERQKRIDMVESALQASSQKAAAAEGKTHEADALIRNYSKDIDSAEERMQQLREKQMVASTNREYLAIINGIEEAKNIKKLRSEQLKEVEEKVARLREVATQAGAARDQLQSKLEAVRAACEQPDDADCSEAELERLYHDRRAPVDPAFLETYERLVAGSHPMPLMPVDGHTRATPVGNLCSLNQIDQIRKGYLVQDAASSAILYIRDAD